MTVHKVSIIPRGVGALGYTISGPTNTGFDVRPELENEITVLLGGRAAETLVFEEVSTGDDDDLAKVTDIARSVGVRYGIDTELHNVPSRRAPIVLSITELPTSRCASTARRRSARSTGPFEDWWTRRDSARERSSTETAISSTRARTLLLERETLDEEELKALATRIWSASLPAQSALRRRLQLLRRSCQRARGEQCPGRRLHVRLPHQRLANQKATHAHPSHSL